MDWMEAMDSVVAEALDINLNVETRDSDPMVTVNWARQSFERWSSRTWWGQTTRIIRNHDVMARKGLA